MEKNVMLSKVVDMVAGVGADMICESLKNWRFYFTPDDKAKVKDQIKAIMWGVVNGR